MVVVDQVKPVVSDDDRDWSYTQIVVQRGRVLLELFTQASGTNLHLRPTDRELGGTEVFQSQLVKLACARIGWTPGKFRIAYCFRHDFSSRIS